MVGDGLMGNFQSIGPLDGCFFQKECGNTLIKAFPHDLLHEPHYIGETARHQLIGII